MERKKVLKELFRLAAAFAVGLSIGLIGATLGLDQRTVQVGAIIASISVYIMLGGLEIGKKRRGGAGEA